PQERALPPRPRRPPLRDRQWALLSRRAQAAHGRLGLRGGADPRRHPDGDAPARRAGSAEVARRPPLPRRAGGASRACPGGRRRRAVPRGFDRDAIPLATGLTWSPPHTL